MVEYWNGGILEWWNTGMVEYWNGGILEWWNAGMVEYWNGGLGNFCSCFHYLSYYIYFLVIGRSLLHLLCSWIPRFEDY